MLILEMMTMLTTRVMEAVTEVCESPLTCRALSRTSPHPILTIIP